MIGTLFDLFIYWHLWLIVCQLSGQDLVRDPFSWDITGRNILMMIIQGFLFFFITILIEYRFFLPQRWVFCHVLQNHFSFLSLCLSIIYFRVARYYFNKGHFWKRFRKQTWRSGEIARLPPMWPCRFVSGPMPSINQSINQPTKQPTNQSINQSSKQSINQSINRL